VFGGVLEEGGLAEACLAADYERTTSSGASVVENVSHGSALGTPAVEHQAIVSLAIETGEIAEANPTRPYLASGHDSKEPVMLRRGAYA
jgi:hypothetical protein